MEKLKDPVKLLRIDHIAIAVKDLEVAIRFFCNKLNFKLTKRREIKGLKTGMISAEVHNNEIKLVLCQGTEATSQISQLIEKYGPGIAHIAFAVADVQETAELLREKGLSFDTSVISGPGLTQVFSSRDDNTGFSFEFIARTGEDNFVQENIEDLFRQLENSEKF